MSDEMQTLVVLAPGFEEIEAITIVDILRRAEVPVVVASLTGESIVVGAHELAVRSDRPLAEVDVERLAMVVLPGGLPGAKHLAESETMVKILQTLAERGKWVAAICAAPLALQSAGLLKNRRLTCYPSCKDYFPESHYQATDVVRDGKIITGSGPGTAMRFSFALLEALGKSRAAETLREGMLAL